MNNAIQLVTAFKEEIGWVFVPRAAGIAVRTRFRPIFIPVSMTIFGMVPLLAGTWSQANTEAPGDFCCAQASGFNDAGIPGPAGAVRHPCGMGLARTGRDGTDMCSAGGVWPVPSPVAERNRGDLCHQVTDPLSGGRSDERRASSEGRCQAGPHGDD